ncbi:MAG: LacI family transcriptional regulator [Paenibacillaceae bacterium]|nr:MAG: LacI family transcriptional regulator [Paenibacillaceae bacterium]
MSVTIKDVARRAGVSPSTVSRVISKHPRISKETIERVTRVMEELGYHPNSMAKGLVSKATHILGVILPRPAEELFQNYFFHEVLRGILAQANRSGYDLLIASGSSESDELETVKRLVRGRRVDGIILLSSKTKDPLIHFLNEVGFPFVIIGRSPDFPDAPTVDNDNVQAAYDATRHLINQGHERIGFVSGPQELTVSQDRLAGYRQAMLEAGLSISEDWIVEGEFLQETGYRAMSMLMNLPERPTALVVIDDIVAFGVLHGLNELGYSVPQDMCLVGFNNISLSEHTSPPLTSVDIGTYQIGYMTAQTLIKTISKEPLHQTRKIIPHRLIVRGSSVK